MPYTLAMFSLWGLLMAVVGFVVGWLLCRVRMRTRSVERHPAQPRSARSHRTEGPAQGEER